MRDARQIQGYSRSTRWCARTRSIPGIRGMAFKEMMTSAFACIHPCTLASSSVFPTINRPHNACRLSAAHMFRSLPKDGPSPGIYRASRRLVLCS